MPGCPPLPSFWRSFQLQAEVRDQGAVCKAGHFRADTAFAPQLRRTHQLAPPRRFTSAFGLDLAPAELHGLPERIIRAPRTRSRYWRAAARARMRRGAMIHDKFTPQAAGRLARTNPGEAGSGAPRESFLSPALSPPSPIRIVSPACAAIPGLRTPIHSLASTFIERDRR